MKTALAKIEEIYDMAINPELDYFAQLEPLAANGELANHNSSLKVLFALCMLVDQQGKTIKGFEQDIVDISKRLQTMEDSLKASNPVVSIPFDPTKPIEHGTLTNPTK